MRDHSARLIDPPPFTLGKGFTTFFAIRISNASSKPMEYLPNATSKKAKRKRDKKDDVSNGGFHNENDHFGKKHYDPCKRCTVDPESTDCANQSKKAEFPIVFFIKQQDHRNTAKHSKEKIFKKDHGSKERAFRAVLSLLQERKLYISKSLICSLAVFHTKKHPCQAQHVIKHTKTHSDDKRQDVEPCQCDL